MLAGPRRQLGAVGPDHPYVQVVEAPHVLAFQPAQERQHHAVVIEQGVVGD